MQKYWYREERAEQPKQLIKYNVEKLKYFLKINLHLVRLEFPALQVYRRAPLSYHLQPQAFCSPDKLISD